MARTTVVSLQRLQLFKSLQDSLNEGKFLGIHATADDALKLKTAVTIDGVSFDGSQSIILPNKVEHIYSRVENVEGDVVTKYYTSDQYTTEVTGSTTAAYVDVNTNRAVYFDGTNFVVVVANDDTPRIAVSEKGAANGVATLDQDKKVPASQLPSYVDDIIEVYTVTTEEEDPENAGQTISVTKFYLDSAHTQEITTGEAGKIYVDVEATIDGSYRWSGSRFVAIGTKVSVADSAINDEDGRGIKATYVEKETNKSLMSADEHTQLASLVADAYIEATAEEIQALFEEEEPAGGGE